MGWYKDAEIYRSEQKDIKEREHSGNLIGYYARAKKENVFLLPIEERTYQIPRGKNGFGQSSIWYAEKQDELKIDIIEYINNYKRPKLATFTLFHYDKEKVQQIESNAVNIVQSYYSALGYSVISKEKDSIGWDLEARKDNITLLVEVKGTSGSEIVVQLTPNEFKNMEENKNKGYRIAIVAKALSSRPELSIFFYSSTPGGNEGWYDESGTIRLEFEKVVSAKVTSVKSN